MKVLVTGGGQVAKALQGYLPRGIELAVMDVDRLDISRRDAVQTTVRRLQPQVIINAAAYTAVDKAESEPASAYAVNADGPAHLAEAACAMDARLLHISTDFVFDGSRSTPYAPEDAPNPLGVYGASKRAGEERVLAICGERALILRGQDGEIRGFHNICKHRGSRLVADEQGKCRNALVCPFHGWVYNLDGTLRGPSRPNSFPPLDKVEFGLTPLDTEVWMGFVFIRFAKGQQGSVAEMMAAFADELRH